MPVVRNTRKFITPAAVPFTCGGLASLIIVNGIIAALDPMPPTNVSSAFVLVGLLANIPKGTTGFEAALIRRAASLTATPSAGPKPAKTGAGKGSWAQQHR